MVKLFQAFPEDFTNVLPLLFEEFMLNELSEKEKERKKYFYSKIFEIKWNSPEKHIGYLLKNEKDEIVGFLGYIFSQRLINNISQKFCNLSAWAVRKDYRNMGLMLTTPINQLKKEYTFVVHTPSYSAGKVFSLLHKFKPLEKQWLMLPLLFPFPKKQKFNLHNEIDSVIHLLTEEEHSIYKDCKDNNARFLYIENEKENCFLVYNKIIKKKRFPFCHILHISNVKIFKKVIVSLRFRLNSELSTMALLVDKRLLKDEKFEFSFKQSSGIPKLYYSETADPEAIDNLYSEYLF